MIRRILPALVAMAVTALGAPARAGDCGDTVGGVRVACACGDTVVTSTILKPGDPVVTSVCAGLGLSIGADTIILDCKGRTIGGDLVDDGIRLAGRTGVTVRGCKLTGFDTSIRLVGSSANRLISNTMSDAGFWAIALELDSQDNLIASNRVVAPAVDGINLGSGASGNTIVGNILDAAGVSGQDGIDIDGPDATGNTIKGNWVSGFPVSGIELDDVDGNTVIENIARGNGIGIRIHGDDTIVAGNAVEDSLDDGILVAGRDNTVDRNRSSRNGASGIEVHGGPEGASHNVITRNAVSFNFAYGISASVDDSTIDRNHGQANGFGGLSVDGTNNTITRNVFDQNAFDGIAISGDGSTIDQNRGRDNGANGLLVSGEGNTVARNVFNHNGEFGICVSPGNIDGDANRAAGNGAGDISFDC